MRLGMQYWAAGALLACAAVTMVVVPVVFVELGVQPSPTLSSLLPVAILASALAAWGCFWLRSGRRLLKQPMAS